MEPEFDAGPGAKVNKLSGVASRRFHEREKRIKENNLDGCWGFFVHIKLLDSAGKEPDGMESVHIGMDGGEYCAYARTL